MESILPVLFITHGSPMLAVEPGKTGPLLTQLGQKLITKEINGIVVISAHWLTPHTSFITSGEKLEIIYDFGGFPDELYQLQYHAKGSPAIAQLVQKQLQYNGMSTQLDPQRGLDHGAWIPLRYMFPNAEIPIIQLSIPWPMNAKQAIEFGKKLKPLRKQGILIMASGSMTHNLYDVGYNNSQEQSYIQPFVNWVRDAVKYHDLNLMENYRELAPFAKHAHPTEEHFLPLIIALATSDTTDDITELNGGVTYQALAMDNYVFGQY